MYKVEMKTSSETLSYMSRFPQLWREAFIKGFDESMDFVERFAKNSFGKPNKPRTRTGRLKNSIKMQALTKGATMVAKLSSDEIYARIQEEGGIIRAKSSKYLTFQIGGGWVKVPSVRIPARPYLNPAVQDNLKKIETIITDSVFKGVK